MYRAIITDNNISGGASHGAFLQQSGAGAQPFSYIYVARNGFVGNGGDGLRIENLLSDGLPHSQLAAIVDNFVSGNAGEGVGVHTTADGANTSLSSVLYVAGNGVFDNGGDGFWVENRASNGASIAQVFNVLAFNNVSGNAGDGIHVENVASGAGSHVSQNVIIAGNTVDANGGTGILVTNFASSGGTVDQTAAVGAVDYNGSTFGNTVTNNAYDGINAFNLATGGGASIGQSLTVLANIATGNGTGPGAGFYKNGIDIGNTGTSGGAISQALNVSGNQASLNSGNGIVLFIKFVENGSTITRTGDLSGNFASGNGLNGLYLFNRAGTTGAVSVAGGTIVKSLTGTSNTAIANSNDGARLVNYAFFGELERVAVGVAQQRRVKSGNASNGVSLVNEATSGGAFISQFVSIDPTIIAGNGANGIGGINDITSATLIQTLAVTDSTIRYNLSDGIRMTTPSAVAASVTTQLLVDNSLVNGNSSDGVFVSGSGLSGSVLSQSTHVRFSQVNSNGGAGITALAFGTSNTTITQNVTVGEDGISNDGARAILVSADGVSGSSVFQSAGIYFNNIASNGTGFNAVKVRATADVSSSLSQAANIASNNVLNAGYTGIYVLASAGGAFTGFTPECQHRQQPRLGRAHPRHLRRHRADQRLGGRDRHRRGPGQRQHRVEPGHPRHPGRHRGQQRETLAETTFHVDGNTVRTAGGIGIYAHNDVDAGGVLTQGVAVAGSSATINDNFVGYASNGGIVVSNHVSGTGATLSQVLTIDPNTVHVRYAGIVVGTGVYTGGVAVQTVTIANNTVWDAQATSGTVAGIGVTNTAGDGTSSGTISQSLAITGNSIVSIGTRSARWRPTASAWW